MKKFKVSFVMDIQDHCMVQKPEQMLEQDRDDGMELGYDISNIKTKLISESPDDLVKGD
jgi:hypothetical protein